MSWGVTSAPGRSTTNLSASIAMLWTTLTLLTVLLPSAAAQAVVASTPMVWTTTAQLTQCRQSNLTWSGSAAPYRIDVAAWGVGKVAPTRRIIGRTNNEYFEWQVDYSEGTELQFEIRDAADNLERSPGRIVVGHGPLSCELYNKAVGAPSASRAASTQSISTGTHPMSRTAWPQTGDPIYHPLKSEPKGPDVGVIVGATVGGVAGLAIILGLLLWVRQLRKKVAALKRRIVEYEATGVSKLQYEESVASRSSEAL